MKRMIISSLFALALAVPATSMAAALSNDQVNAIMGVLAAFGVDQTTLNAVYADLTATSTVSVATSTPATASSTPVAITPAFTAATSTVIAPNSGSVCGASCLTYGPAVVPSSGSVATVTPSLPTGWYKFADGIARPKACRVMDRNGNVLDQAHIATSTAPHINCVTWETAANARANGYFFAQPNGGVSELLNDITSGTALPTI